MSRAYSPGIRLFVEGIDLDVSRAPLGQAPGTLPDGVDQFPYSREMMIVVFGDKIQMVYEPHRRLQTGVGNGSSK